MSSCVPRGILKPRAVVATQVRWRRGLCGTTTGKAVDYGFVGCALAPEALARLHIERGALLLTSDCHLVLEHGPASRPNVLTVSRLAGGAVWPEGRFLRTLLLRRQPHWFPMKAGFGRTLELAFVEAQGAKARSNLGPPGEDVACPSSDNALPLMPMASRRAAGVGCGHFGARLLSSPRE